MYEQFAAREPASSWYRTQVRQAVRFGAFWAGIGALALLWPLLISLLVQNITATLVAYSIALVLDAALFVIWVRAALRYSRRALRGETFALKG